MGTSYVIVMVTTVSKQEAEKISRQLLNEKLIACANVIGPISSFFHWSGKIEAVEEYLVLMKSRADLFERLSDRVRVMHSYAVPEILGIPVVEGSKAYLDWLGSCLQAIS